MIVVSNCTNLGSVFAQVDRRYSPCLCFDRSEWWVTDGLYVTRHDSYVNPVQADIVNNL